MVLARDPHNAFLGHASVFRVLWHPNGDIQNGHRLFKCITEVFDQHLALRKALHNPRGGQLICGAIDALQLLLITPQHNISALCIVIILRSNLQLW